MPDENLIFNNVETYNRNNSLKGIPYFDCLSAN
jgi:hypothetical protein